MGQTVSKELVSEVLSMLVYKNVGETNPPVPPVILLLTHHTDQLTSMASTVGFKPDDLQKLASMIKTAKGWCTALHSLLSTAHEVTGLGSNQYTACAIGR